MFDVGDGSYQEAWFHFFPLHCAHSHGLWFCLIMVSVFSVESQVEEIAALFSSPIDLWDDAGMENVVQYLKACPMLALPASWPADW